MENKIKTNDSILLSNIYSDTCTIIEDARDRAYRAVNTALTIRNWMLGERIAREHLGDDGRAEYGKYIISSLAEMLTKKYGKGFDRKDLYDYVKFYNLFPEIVDSVRPQLQSSEKQSGTIVSAVSRQLLPWTLYRELIRVENLDARNWYAKEATREVWSSRTLHRNIASQYYFRTDMGDFYIDLFFYNYILKCFFLIDIKTTQITHQDVGQMDMYVRMYDQLQRTDGDNPTIGLLLCSETSDDMARYSVLHGNEQIFQAKYLTYLPTKEELIKEIEYQKEIFLHQKEESE